jgi:hypothetical protein
VKITWNCSILNFFQKAKVFNIMYKVKHVICKPLLKICQNISFFWNPMNFPLINDPYEIIYIENWSKFLLNAIDSVGITLCRLFIAYFLYGPITFYSLNIRDNFKPLLKRGNLFLHFIYNWSFFRGCIDGYCDIIFVGGIWILIKINFFLNNWVINESVNVWRTLKFFDALNCESKGENNTKVRSLSMFLGL